MKEMIKYRIESYEQYVKEKDDRIKNLYSENASEVLIFAEIATKNRLQGSLDAYKYMYEQLV
jgi:hypothetical protein